MKHQRALANHEMVTIALYLLGGESQPVDTEDIAVKANQLAPGRFTWRKYPEQINIDTVRKRLWDAMKQDKGAFVLGSEKDGWVLTENGIRFARMNSHTAAGAAQQKGRLTLREKQWRRTEQNRILLNSAFIKARDVGLHSVSVKEAEAFFRIDDYVVGLARIRKIQRLLNAFCDDSEVFEIIKGLAGKVRREEK
jgi:hypothetical protein